MKTALNVILATVILGSSAGAFAAAPFAESAAVTGAFCPAIYDRKSYARGDLDHYAVLIPGKEGWIFRTENDFRPDWHNKGQAVKNLAALQAAFKQHNADLVVVIPPVRGLAEADQLNDQYKKAYLGDPATAWKNYEASIASLRSNGINAVGLSRNEVKGDFFYKRNHHWSPQGAHATAQKISTFVKTLPSYRSIAKTQYISRPSQPTLLDSSFQKAFKQICGKNIPDEMAATFETVPVITANTAAGLLGKQIEPQIVLLGTSNSVPDASTANFEGFLKEALSSDILNLSFMGAGIDTSIMSYLNSGHFKSPQPKIVIWEVPGYYSFNEQDKLFNQLIPAAIGNCQPLFEKELNLLNADSYIYDVTQDTVQPRIASTDGYIHLAFSNPIRDKFTVKFSYDNGQNKKTDFSRSERYPADGDFYTIFPASTSPAFINKIKIVPPRCTGTTKVKAQICKLPQGPE